MRPLKPCSEERATKSPCSDPTVSTVALNFQTPGYEMDLNAGRFLVNGQCGYILKPACLRQPHTSFDPECPGLPRTTLTIQVSSLDQALPALRAGAGGSSPRGASLKWRKTRRLGVGLVGGPSGCESHVGRVSAEGKACPALVRARLKLSFVPHRC